ncbi:MAG: nucleotidyltransferase family protein [Polyangiaceae bacterium]
MLHPRVITAILAASPARQHGQPRPLLCRDGETYVSRVAVAAIASRSAEVAVVTGAHRDEVEAEVMGSGVRCLYNACFREGIASSLRIAACWAVRQPCDAVLFLPGDQPHVSGLHVDRLIDAFEQHGGRVASYWGGIPSAPAVFPREDLGELLRLRGDEGLRPLLAGDDVWCVPFAGGELEMESVEEPLRESGVHPIASFAELAEELARPMRIRDA